MAEKGGRIEDAVIAKIFSLSDPVADVDANPSVCVVSFATLGATWATVLANFIGGLLFFWVDRWIFNKTNILRGEVWEVREHITCTDGGAPADRGYRLAKASNYDKTADRRPEFRCHECSRLKYDRDHVNREETPDTSAAVEHDIVLVDAE